MKNKYVVKLADDSSQTVIATDYGIDESGHLSFYIIVYPREKSSMSPFLIPQISRDTVASFNSNSWVSVINTSVNQNQEDSVEAQSAGKAHST